MTDFITTSGRWYNIVNGKIIGESWGVPEKIDGYDGVFKQAPLTTIKAHGWYPSIEYGKEDFNTEMYEQNFNAILTGDIVSLNYLSVTPKNLNEVQEKSIKKINDEAKQNYSRYDTALLRKVRTGEDLYPEIQEALDYIQKVANDSRNIIKNAQSVDEIAAIFPIKWSE